MRREIVGAVIRVRLTEMISGESITKVCDAIDGLTDEQFKAEFDRFLDTQSVLSYFFEQAVPNEKEMLDFVVYQSFIVWKCYETDHPGKAITVGWQHLEAAVNDTKAWWSRLEAEADHLDPNGWSRYFGISFWNSTRFPEMQAN